MSPDAQHCDMGGDDGVYCGNNDVHGANRDIWVHNPVLEQAPGHIVVSSQVCLLLCLTVRFQGGTLSASTTTGTGLPLGVMARSLDWVGEPSCGAALQPATRRWRWARSNWRG
jgi:hypothetical protein